MLPVLHSDSASMEQDVFRALLLVFPSHLSKITETWSRLQNLGATNDRGHTGLGDRTVEFIGLLIEN